MNITKNGQCSFALLELQIGTKVDRLAFGGLLKDDGDIERESKRKPILS